MRRGGRVRAASRHRAHGAITCRPYAQTWPSPMSSTHRIHATWLEKADSAEGFWSPLPNSEQFFVVSCYVSVDGWRKLESHLRAGLDRTPPLKALLIFSRAGLESSGGVHLLDEMKTFIDSTLKFGSVDICIVDDHRQELFHPKAHASRAGLRSRVVVGSANLTRGGMADHYEMGTVVENDHAVLADFERAIYALAGHAPSLKNDENYKRLRARPSQPRPPPPRPFPGRQGGTPRAPLETDQAELFPYHFPAHLGSTMEVVSEFFQSGRKMSRTAKSLEFSTKIRLHSLQRAGILETSGKKELSRTVSLDKGSGDFTVKLFPPILEKKIDRFKRAVGALYGSTTISVAGIVWIPAEWGEALRAKWRELISELRLQSLIKDLASSGPRTLGQFDPGTHFFRALEEDLAIATPASWYEDAREILGISASVPLPIEVTAELRGKVARFACAQLQRGCASSIEAACREDKFAHLSELPRFGEVFAPSPADAIDILAEISLLPVAAFTGSGEGAKNAIASRFAKKLVCDPIAEGVIREAQFWKQRLSGDPLPVSEDLDQLLSRAWEHFQRWFQEDLLAPSHYSALPEQLWPAQKPTYVIDGKRADRRKTEQVPR